MAKSSKALRAQDDSSQNAAPDSALLRSEDVARQLEQAFAAQPARKVTMEVESAEASRYTATAGERTTPPQPQDLGVRDRNFPPRGHVHKKSNKAQGLLGMLEENDDPRGEAQKDGLEDVTPGVVEDEDEIWKKFVFDGDTAEISRKAYARAAEKTKQELLESVIKVGSDVAEAPSSSIPDVRSPGSDHPPSRRLLEDPQGAGTPSCASIAATGAPTTTSAIPTMTSAPSVAAEAGSSSNGPRFHQPTPFIGRLSSAVPPPKRPRSPNKRPRGRPRKRRDYRRPNIRTMPNFEGDPIESSNGTDQSDGDD